MHATHENERRQSPHPGATHTQVSAIMSRDVITVRSGTSLEAVVELMLSRGLSRVPVVDEGYKPLGIISKTDVIEESHDRGSDGEEPQRTARFDKYVERGFQEAKQGAFADEVMTRTLVTIEQTASVVAAAELMVARHVHGLPVVAPTGELVGFVSTMDVLAWLAGMR